MKIFAMCLVLVVLLLPTPQYADVLAADAPAQKAVLITGASSGIGRSTAELLAGAGYFVYAGARKEADIEALNAIDNIMAVRLDVTKQDQIDAAVELIAAEGRGLWGIVNNAGVNVIEPLIEADEDNLRFLFDVNVYGVFRVTKAFAPMVIESQGRIVNISSIAGILSGGLDGYGMYMMSKHAVESFTDQLAWEMARFNVKVSAVEPGNYKSQIGASRCKRMLADGIDQKYVYYADVMQRYFDSCAEYIKEGAASDSQPPDDVSAAIKHALFAENPKEHYLVVPDPFQNMITIGKSFEELLHLNHDHAFSYSRGELIDLMDEEWAILRGEKDRNWGETDASAQATTNVAGAGDVIAVIGTGDMGDSLGPKLAEIGYRIVYGSRDPSREFVQELVERTGNGASATTPMEAAQAADIVLLAVGWPPMEQVAQNLGDLDGKVVIDVSFAFEQGEDGYPVMSVDTSSAEMIQGWNPGAKVVKWSLPTALYIDDPQLTGKPPANFIAADDRVAKELVAQMAVAIGQDPIDAGPLRMSRAVESQVLLFMVPIYQGREEGWESLHFRTSYWPCNWGEDWSVPVADADNLAEFPERDTPPIPCTKFPPRP